MSSEPNISFGSPIILFDSHPDEQESLVYSYFSSLRSTLHIAFTGKVPKFHAPGTLRIVWYTTDGKQGFKDYELHEHALVRENFDHLLDLDDVRRVVIMGYSGQNPYLAENGGMYQRVALNGRKVRGWEEDSVKKARLEKEKEAMNNSREGREGKLIDIDAVIEKSDRQEEKRRKEEMERVLQDTSKKGWKNAEIV